MTAPGNARLGFVGCGTIAQAMIDGLARAGDTAPVVVSPRNAEVARGLAARHAHVAIATDNQAVLDASDLVVLAVRPQIVWEVLAGLKFDAHHRVLSLVATAPLARIEAATAPAAVVTRAVPLPAVARGLGATAVYPARDEIVALFDRIGTAVPASDEAAFDVFTAATAMMASHFAFADAVVRWMADRGVAQREAHVFFATILAGLADTAVAAGGRSFAVLADEHQTRGGLNEQVRDALEHDGMSAAVARALDGVLGRIRGAPPASGASPDGS